MPSQDELRALFARHPDLTPSIIAAKIGTTERRVRSFLADKHTTNYRPIPEDWWPKILEAFGE